MGRRGDDIEEFRGDKKEFVNFVLEQALKPPTRRERWLLLCERIAMPFSLAWFLMKELALSPFRRSDD